LKRNRGANDDDSEVRTFEAARRTANAAYRSWFRDYYKMKSDQMEEDRIYFEEFCEPDGIPAKRA
jgi:hypothetical protein